MSMAAHQLPKNRRLEPRSPQGCEAPRAPKTSAVAASTRMKNHEKPRDMLVPSAASAPGQRADTEEQAEHGAAQIVGDMGKIQGSGRERLEMHRERHVDEQRVEGVRKQIAIFVDDPQH